MWNFWKKNLQKEWQVRTEDERWTSWESKMTKAQLVSFQMVSFQMVSFKLSKVNEWRLEIARDLSRQRARSHKLIRIARQQTHVLLLSPLYIHSYIVMYCDMPTCIIYMYMYCLLLVNDCLNDCQNKDIERWKMAHVFESLQILYSISYQILTPECCIATWRFLFEIDLS